VDHRVETDDALKVQPKVFGYEDLRGVQRPIIDHLIGDGDALLRMPTGGGSRTDPPAINRTFPSQRWRATA